MPVTVLDAGAVEVTDSSPFVETHCLRVISRLFCSGSLYLSNFVKCDIAAHSTTLNYADDVMWLLDYVGLGPGHLLVQ